MHAWSSGIQPRREAWRAQKIKAIHEKHVSFGDCATEGSTIKLSTLLQIMNKD